MTSTRDLTIRLNAGEAEKLNLGEIHLIIATHSPHEGARDLFRTISFLAPSEVASDQPRPIDYIRKVLAEALRSLENTEG